ncbi:MAG: T9SS type A sorting domain-containing protein [Bacteroidetes bacterium]|nr:T9SS type A sorting domain-containing protein [Bacteroidota bacterium]
MFDISIGEPFIYAIEDASSIFTCGYIQPEIAAVNGIKHEQNTDQVNVYPNPFSEVLYIQTTLNNLNCCVYDMLGRMVFEGKCTQAINLSFLSKGIYTLSIYDQYNQVMTNIKVCKSNE